MSAPQLRTYVCGRTHNACTKLSPLLSNWRRLYYIKPGVTRGCQQQMYTCVRTYMYQLSVLVVYACVFACVFACIFACVFAWFCMRWDIQDSLLFWRASYFGHGLHKLALPGRVRWFELQSFSTRELSQLHTYVRTYMLLHKVMQGEHGRKQQS